MPRVAGRALFFCAHAEILFNLEQGLAQDAGDDLKNSSRLDDQPNPIVGAVMRVCKLVGIRMNKSKSATSGIC
jgi:hypothetical protein